MLQESGLMPGYPGLQGGGFRWEPGIRRKIAQFCNVEVGRTLLLPLDASSIYEVPLLMLEEGLDRRVYRKTGYPG